MTSLLCKQYSKSTFLGNHNLKKYFGQKLFSWNKDFFGKFSKISKTSCPSKRPRQTVQTQIICFFRSSLIRVSLVCYSDECFANSSPDNQHFISSPEPKAQGELIGWDSSRSPSVHPHFQTWISLRLAGWLKSNFIWSIIGMGERLHKILVQIGLELWFPWQQIVPIGL